MPLAKKISGHGTGMQARSYNRFTAHSFILGLVLLGSVMQNYHASSQGAVQKLSLRQPAAIQAQSAGSYPAVQHYAGGEGDDEKKSSKFSVLSAKPAETAVQYQILAKRLTVREVPNGRVEGLRSIGDIIEVTEQVLADGALWGKTGEGYIALSEGSKIYSEKMLKAASTAITQGGVNYLERLLWTEVTPYEGYPEEDYKTAIMNILNVIDSRARSGIFPQSVLGAAVVDSQFSGLTDARLKMLLKGRNGIDMEYSRLTLEELANFYSASRSGESAITESIRKKLSLIDETVQEYLESGVRNPMPADTLFFKNTPEKWDGKRWHDASTGNYLFTTVYARSDPDSIPKGKRHDYYRRVVEPGLRGAN